MLGNATLRATWPALTLHAHEEAAARTRTAVERVHGYFRADDADPYGPEVLATEALPAETTFSSVGVIDLGDRVLELMHPGRGHTGGDLVVRIGDVDVVVLGDLVEEAGPPVFGPDSFPLEWSATLDTAIGLTTEATTLVPGHGAVVPRSFVQEQRGDITAVAEIIRAAAAQGLNGVEETLRDGEWPFPADTLEDAVRRGFAQLPAAVTPASARQLPLAWTDGASGSGPRLSALALPARPRDRRGALAVAFGHVLPRPLRFRRAHRRLAQAQEGALGRHPGREGHGRRGRHHGVLRRGGQVRP